MDNISTTRLSNITRTRADEQNDTSMSEDEFTVGPNQRSFNQLDIGKQEIEELQWIKKGMKLKHVSKLSSKHRHDKILKSNCFSFNDQYIFSNHKTNTYILATQE